jgi:hypothetical protein
VNVEQLRKSLKVKWLSYYRENRSWLVRLGVWGNFEGQRRPSSSFILATMSILEPRLTHILPLIVDLNSNPDRVVSALGLNFSPDNELEALSEADESHDSSKIKLLPGETTTAMTFDKVTDSQKPSQIATQSDESCQGVRGHHPEGHRDIR